MQWLYFPQMKKGDQLFYYLKDGQPQFCFPGQYPDEFVEELRENNFQRSERGFYAPLSYGVAQFLRNLPGATVVEIPAAQVLLSAVIPNLQEDTTEKKHEETFERSTPPEGLTVEAWERAKHHGLTYLGKNFKDLPVYQREDGQRVTDIMRGGFAQQEQTIKFTDDHIPIFDAPEELYKDGELSFLTKEEVEQYKLMDSGLLEAPSLPLLKIVYSEIEKKYKDHICLLEFLLKNNDLIPNSQVCKDFARLNRFIFQSILSIIIHDVRQKLRQRHWEAGENEWPMKKGKFLIDIKEKDIQKCYELPTFIFSDALGSGYEMRLGFNTTTDMLVSELDVPEAMYPLPTPKPNQENQDDTQRRRSAEQSVVADAPAIFAGEPASRNSSEVPDKSRGFTDGAGSKNAERRGKDLTIGTTEDAGGLLERDPDRDGLPAGRSKRERHAAGKGAKRQDLELDGEPAAQDSQDGNINSRHRNASHFFGDVSQPAYPSGPTARGKANIAAIHLLKSLQNEGRQPTEEEKIVLAGFSGWGSFGGKVFNEGYAYMAKREGEGKNLYLTSFERPSYEEWKKHYGKELYPALGGQLTEEEWESAAGSILNAHYTSPEVVAAMWAMVERFGFHGGKILEPAAGTGAFLRYMPHDIAYASNINTIELDKTTGKILTLLYPDADVEIGGFEVSKVAKDNSFDLIISNFPFGNYQVYDPTHKKYNNQSIHNYFISRSIDAAKPGGIVIAITSHYSLDAVSSRNVREEWAKKADFVGAIRLPNNAFKDSAGTSVVTDIIIFRRKNQFLFPNSENFLSTVKFQNTNDYIIEGDEEYFINEYFLRHPEMILGQQTISRNGMYEKNEYTVTPDPNIVLEEGLKKVINFLPQDIVFSINISTNSSSKMDEDSKKTNIAYKEGCLVLTESGEPAFVENGCYTIPEWSSQNRKKEQAIAYIQLKNCLSNLLFVMNNDEEDLEFNVLQKQINVLYDEYIKLYGYVSPNRSNAFLQNDLEYPNISSLELCKMVPSTDKETGEIYLKKSLEKADIFIKLTVYPFKLPTSASSIQDALKISLVFYNAINVSYVASLLDISEEAAKKLALESGELFINPETGLLESKDIYLSGNVKEKLIKAEESLQENLEFQANVSALTRVQPAPQPINFIYVKLGTSWLPTDIIEKFLRDLKVGSPHVQCTRINGFNIEDGTTSWHIQKLNIDSGEGLKWQVRENIGVFELVEDCLNLRRTKVFDAYQEDGKVKYVENKELPLLAQEKQRELQDLFKKFVRNDSQVSAQIEEIYNELFNGHVLREFSVPEIEFFPGASHTVLLRPNQKRGISRAVQESTLLAHGVGTGKTYELITIAMEMRRLKTAQKPWIVIQGSTLNQFAASFKRLYPNAKILAPTEKQRSADNRQRLLAQIATGDWDAIITPHSFFNSVSVSPETEQKNIREAIQYYSEIYPEKAYDKKSQKQFQRKIKKLKVRLAKLMDIKKDNNIYFEDLGVDALLVDEAHAYKRGTFETKMNNVKGLDLDGSQRSMQFLMKTQLVREKTGGKNIILATGTPIPNTLTELWTLFRYTRPDLLSQFNVTQFDDFASTFAETSVALEETATGDFKMVERFNTYVNGQELLTMWRMGADVALAENMPYLEGRPRLKGGKPQEIAVERSEELANYIRFLKKQRDEWDHSNGAYKRDHPSLPLEVYTAARRASIDLRLVNPEYPDIPQSKYYCSKYLRKMEEKC